MTEQLIIAKMSYYCLIDHRGEYRYFCDLNDIDVFIVLIFLD